MQAGSIADEADVLEVADGQVSGRTFGAKLRRRLAAYSYVRAVALADAEEIGSSKYRQVESALLNLGEGVPDIVEGWW